jgi:hypothetical protein
MGNREWGMRNGDWGMGSGECGMRNGEFGMGNVECGMRKRERMTEIDECGMRKGECGMGKAEREVVECLVFVFSAFRIPTSEFHAPETLKQECYR